MAETYLKFLKYYLPVESIILFLIFKSDLIDLLSDNFVLCFLIEHFFISGNFIAAGINCCEVEGLNNNETFELFENKFEYKFVALIF